MCLYNHYFRYILNKKKLSKIINIIFFPFFKLRYYYHRYNHYKYIITNSDNVILLSNGYKKSFPFLFKTSHKVKIIPNPVSNLDKKPYNYKNKEKIILYVGRLDKIQKSPQHLLYIWQRLFIKYPDWKLILVGDGPDKKYLENIVIKKHLKNVLFTGFQEPYEYYKRASIFCMTSQTEGYPMVLPEAMGHYCVPIIFNSYAAAIDIIDNGYNGILVSKNNISEYTQQLEKVITDTEYRTALALNAFNKSKSFHIDNIIPLWENLFNL